MGIVRTIKYIAQSAYSRIDPNYRRNDEFGRCAVCGNYSRYKLGKALEPGSDMAVSCGWDEKFVGEINTTNTLRCGYCESKFRVRCAAESMLKYSWKGEIRSIAELVRKLGLGETDTGWQVLETTACEGVFSGFPDAKFVTRSEYFDDVERGGCKNNIRSEDLQALTFPDNSFDVIIALDVFEHIKDPMKAFSEVRRVIKPSGVGIVTFPIDERVKKTKSLAGKKAYHNDPLRKEGSPVFTEFGTDIADILVSSGYKVSWNIYKTERTGVKQRVLVLCK